MKNAKTKTNDFKLDEKQHFIATTHEDLVEEDTLTELNQIAILSSSKFSLKQRQNVDNVVCDDEDEPKSKIESFLKKIPLKGYILAITSAFLASFLSILLKFSTTLNASDSCKKILI
jgi:hypothetical protein